MELVSYSFPSLVFPIKECHPNGFLTPHIIQSLESAVRLYFVWVYFALGGSVSVHKSYILGTSQREVVVLSAAHGCRLKSQCSNLRTHVLDTVTDGQGCWPSSSSLPKRLPGICSWGVGGGGDEGSVIYNLT